MYDDLTGRLLGSQPELLDTVIEQMRIWLSGALPWLDAAHGRAERIVKFDNTGRRVYLPVEYTGEGNDYVPLTPDSGEGNFCFFWVGDPQAVDLSDRLQAAIKARCSLIFWWDYRRIFEACGIRDREAVKRQVLDALGSMVLRNGRFAAEKLYELAENIYQGFTLDEIDNQFLMHPYGGLRVEGEISATGNCIL